MKKCYKCGQEIEDGSLFCTSCGAEIVDEPEKEEQNYTFCHNCGEKIGADTMFCPNCGTNIKVAPKKSAGLPSVKKFINPKTIGIAAVGVVAILCVVLVSSLLRSPAKAFVSYQKELIFDSVMPNVVEFGDEYNSRGQLSTDITLTARADNDDLNDYLEDSSVVLKADLKQDALLLNAELTLMGSKMLDGTLNYDKDVLGIYVPQLDDTYYTMNTSNIDNVFGLDNSYDLQGLEIPKVDTKTLSSLAECYTDIVLGAVNKKNVRVSDKKSFRLDQLRTTLDGKVYIFEPTQEDIEEMLLKLADTIETDEELRGFVTSFLGANIDLINSVNDTDVEEELEDSLLDAAEYLRDNSSRIAREAEREEFRWILGVNDGKVCMDRIELNDGEQVFAYERDGNDCICYYSSYDNIQGSIELKYEKNGKTFDGEVNISDGYSTMTIEFRDINREKKSALGISYGSYRLYFSDEDSNIEVDVNKAENGGTDHIIRVEDSYWSSFVGSYIYSFDIIINTTDRKSTAALPKAIKLDISDYTYRETEELFEELGEAAEDLANDFYRQLYAW